MVPKSNPLPKIDQVIHQSYKSEVDIDKNWFKIILNGDNIELIIRSI